MDSSTEMALRDMAERHIELHILHWDDPNGWLASLLTNKPQWTVGFDDLDQYYWVRPTTPEGGMLRPPFNILRWDAHDFKALMAAHEMG